MCLYTCVRVYVLYVCAVGFFTRACLSGFCVVRARRARPRWFTCCTHCCCCCYLDSRIVAARRRRPRRRALGVELLGWMHARTLFKCPPLVIHVAGPATAVAVVDVIIVVVVCSLVRSLARCSPPPTWDAHFVESCLDTTHNAELGTCCKGRVVGGAKLVTINNAPELER